MENVFSTAISNEMKNLTGLADDIDIFLHQHGISAKHRNTVNLVVEEAVTNVIKYGYTDTASHTIDVGITVDAEEIAVRVADDGTPFNPLTVPRLDRSRPPIEQPEGGMGIHLVRNIMRSMTYRQAEGKNIFEIWVKR